MIYTDLTKKALKLCFEAHKDQTDKAGMPYVFHPFHLAECMDDEISTACALLHDVAEDTDITIEELSEMGFPEEITRALRLLKHEEGVEYFDYVRKIAENPTAAKVKLADLRHNSDLTRLACVDDAARERAKKYAKAIEMLTK